MTIYLSLEAPYGWVTLDRRGEVTDQGAAESLTEIPHSQNRSRIIGVAPGESILCFTVRVPTRSRRKLEAAIPYALEDKLSEDIAGLHFALLHWNPGDAAQVAVVSKTRLDDWIEQTSEAGIRLDEVVADYFVTPIHPQAQVTVAAMSDDRICVRHDRYAGTTIDGDSIDTWWNELEDRDTAVAVNDRDLAARLIALGGTRVSEWNCGSTFADWLAVSPGDHAVGNVLTGAYVPPHQRQSNAGMKAAIIMLGVAGLLKLTFDAAEYVYLTRKNDRLDSHIEKVLRWTIPDVPRVTNPRLQMTEAMQALLARESRESGFTELLGAIAASVPPAGGEVQEIVFKDGAMTVTCTVADFAGLDRVKQAMEQIAGISVTLVSSGAQDRRVSGRFQLTRGST